MCTTAYLWCHSTVLYMCVCVFLSLSVRFKYPTVLITTYDYLHYYIQLSSLHCCNYCISQSPFHCRNYQHYIPLSPFHCPNCYIPLSPFHFSNYYIWVSHSTVLISTFCFDSFWHTSVHLCLMPECHIRYFIYTCYLWSYVYSWFYTCYILKLLFDFRMSSISYHHEPWRSGQWVSLTRGKWAHLNIRKLILVGFLKY